jgi:hypothetical protein
VSTQLDERPLALEGEAHSVRRGMTHLYHLACNPTIPRLPEGATARCGRVRRSSTTAQQMKLAGVECVVCADAHMHDYCAGCGR